MCPEAMGRKFRDHKRSLWRKTCLCSFFCFGVEKLVDAKLFLPRNEISLLPFLKRSSTPDKMSNPTVTTVPPSSMAPTQSPCGSSFPPAPKYDWCTSPPVDPNDHDWFWPLDKRVLTVSFLNGSLDEKTIVMNAVNEHYNTIKMGIWFKFIQENGSTPSDIRVMFADECKSKNGYMAAAVPRNEPTLWLDVSPTYNMGKEHIRQGTILHEFGHALGLKHAHSHPDSNVDWNFKAINEMYGLDYEHFVVQFVKKSTGIISLIPYDRNSIMHYTVRSADTHSMITSVDFPFVLSKGDKKFLMAIYPLDGSGRTLKGVTERMRKPPSELLRGKKRLDLRSASRRGLSHLIEKVEPSNNPLTEQEIAYLGNPLTHIQSENAAAVFIQTIIPRGYREDVIGISVLYCALMILVGFALFHH